MIVKSDNRLQAFRRSLDSISSEVLRSLYRMLTFVSVTSLFISGTGFFKTYIAYILLGIEPCLSVCFTVSLISFCVYSLDKVADINKDLINTPQRARFLQGRRTKILVYAISAYLLALVLTCILNPSAIWVALLPFIVNLFYGIQLSPRIPRLKDIPVVKNVAVALTWAFVATLMPAYQYISSTSNVGLSISNDRSSELYVLSIPVILAVLLFMTVKTFIDTVLYDLRDVEGDKIEGVKTLPVIAGKRATFKILLSLNATLFICFPMLSHKVYSLVAVLIAYGFFYIIYLQNKLDPVVLDLLVEGEWMWATLTLIILSFF